MLSGRLTANTNFSTALASSPSKTSSTFFTRFYHKGRRWQPDACSVSSDGLCGQQASRDLILLSTVFYASNVIGVDWDHHGNCAFSNYLNSKYSEKNAKSLQQKMIPEMTFLVTHTRLWRGGDWGTCCTFEGF